MSDVPLGTPFFAIAVGRFYTDLAERLVAGAQRAFTEAGHEPADVHEVPGAFELPLAARYLADTGRYAGVACLGAVIRGETDHYDYVCAEAARAAFEAAGGEVDVFDVPGAYELPLAAKYCAQSGRYAGVAALGAVIRGETTHYDYVCGECARGLMDVQLQTGVPCAFGVLTVENMDQALARAGGGKRDQGRHAAEAVLMMVALRGTLGV